MLAQHAEGTRSVKLRHRVVRDHGIPGLLTQGGVHGVPRLDPFKRDLVASLRQRSDDERSVVVRVLHEKDADGGHATLPGPGRGECGGGGSLRTSQKSPKYLTASKNSAKSTGFRT